MVKLLKIRYLKDIKLQDGYSQNFEKILLVKSPIIQLFFCIFEGVWNLLLLFNDLVILARKFSVFLLFWLKI